MTRTRAIVGAIVVSIAVILVQGPALGEQQGTQPRQFTVALPAGVNLAGAFAVSPDGQHLAFVASRAGGPALIWLGPLEETAAARPLPGTDNAGSLFWSADGRAIGFFADGKLKTIAVSGGSPRTVCDAPNPRGATWNQDGVIVAALGSRDGLSRIAASGGTPVPVTTLDAERQDGSHRGPQFLPDGRRFLFQLLASRRELSGLFLGSLDSKEITRLPGRIIGAGYVPPGYLIYQRQGRVMAQPFDLERLESTGDPVPITEQLPSAERTGPIRISASRTGVLAYQSGGGNPTSELAWFDRQGKRLGSLGPPASYRGDIRISPDGRRVAVGRVDPQTDSTDIWMLDVSSGAASPFTSGPGNDGSLVWSPDGSSVVFTARRDAFADLYQRPSQGDGQEELILTTGATKMPNQWSADGKFIVFHTASAKTTWDLWVLPMTGDRKAVPYLQTKHEEWLGQISPDGRWLTYMSNESGSTEVYVQSFPVPGRKKQISKGGGASPQWRSDGKEIYYLRPDATIMAATVSTGGSFEVTSPKPLFKARLPGGAVSGYENNFAATAEGQQFLVNTLIGELPSIPITVLVNWPASLGSRGKKADR